MNEIRKYLEQFLVWLECYGGYLILEDCSTPFGGPYDDMNERFKYLHRDSSELIDEFEHFKEINNHYEKLLDPDNEEILEYKLH